MTRAEQIDGLILQLAQLEVELRSLGCDEARWLLCEALDELEANLFVIELESTEHAAP